MPPHNKKPCDGGVRLFNVDADVLFLEERGCQVATGEVQINSTIPLKFKAIKGMVRWEFSTHYSRRGRFRGENAFYRIKNGHIFPEI